MSRKYQTKVFGSGTAGKIVRWLSPNTLQADTGIVNADISALAAIAYSKLSLALSIVNADIKADAAIAMSKLNLAITNNEVAAGAAIAQSKLAGHGVTRNGVNVNTVYQNTTGKTILVVKTFLSNSDASCFYADGSNPPTTIRHRNASSNLQRQMIGIVLNNEYYKIADEGGNWMISEMDGDIITL